MSHLKVEKFFSWNFNLNCAKAPQLYIKGWCFELMSTGMLRIKIQVMLLRITCTETNGVWKVFFGMLLRSGDSKSLYSSKSRTRIDAANSNQCRELKLMRRPQINAEYSNEYSDAELDLISFPDSTHQCHFTLFSFSLIVVTQKMQKSA